MKNGILPIVLLVLLLIAGLAGGAYFLLSSDGDDNSTISQTNGQADENTACTSGEPDSPDIEKPDGNCGPENPDGNKSEPQPEKPDPDSTDLNKPLIEPDQPTDPVVAKNFEYVPKTVETKIHGTVRYKKDNRTVSGAEVGAALADTASFGMGGNDMARVVIPDDEDGIIAPDMKVVGSTTTDADGKYELTLKVTYYELKILNKDKNPDGEPDEDRNAFKGNPLPDMIIVIAKVPGFAPAKSQWLNVTEGEDQEVNLLLAIPAMISGRVIDAVTGEGIVGANGRLNLVDQLTDGMTTPILFTTVEDGRFKVEVPAAQYTLGVSADGYVTKRQWGAGAKRIDATQGGEVIFGDVSLLKAATITGTVVDENGNPVKFAEVGAENQNGGFGFSSSSGSTDENGKFEIDSVTPGTFTLRAKADGYAQTKIESLTLTAGQRLDVGQVILGRGLTLVGIVTSPDGAVLPDVMLSISESKKAGLFGMGMDIPFAYGRSDEDGHYEISGLTEGDWVISASSEKFAKYKQDVKIESSNNQHDVQLSKGGTVVGKVVGADGKPVSSATVSLIDHESQVYNWYKLQPSMATSRLSILGQGSQQSDEDGLFTHDKLIPGTYLVIATDENGASALIDDVKVRNDEETDVGVLKFEGGGAALIIVLENGLPLRDVKVTLVQGWGSESGNGGVTDSTGSTLIEDIPSGEYTIRTDLERDTFDTDAMSRRRLKVVSGETVEFTLELRPQDGVHLHGRLTMNGENVFTEVMLIGKGNLSSTFKSFKITDGGMYEFHGLKLGTYGIHAKINDDQPAAVSSVTLKEDGDVEFSRDFRGVTLSGVVNTPNNSPEERASVKIVIQDKNLEKGSMAAFFRGVMTVSNKGVFEMSNIPEGEYQLTAELPGVGVVTKDVTVQGGDVSGISLTVTANGGSLTVTIKDFIGEPLSSGGFANVQLFDSKGDLVTFSRQASGLFMMAVGAEKEFPMLKPDTYSVTIDAIGFLSKVIEGVVVKQAEKTEIEASMEAASELNLTVTNTEVTQAMLDTAKITVVHADGKETEPVTNMLDLWANQNPPSKPTLSVRYLSSEVSEIRIKLDGYAEITVPVETQVATKNSKEETLVTG